jgi:hypothetical protein
METQDMTLQASNFMSKDNNFEPSLTPEPELENLRLQREKDRLVKQISQLKLDISKVNLTRMSINFVFRI